MVTLALSWLVFHDGSRRPASSTATRIPGTPASPADVADGGVTGYEEEDDVRAGSLGWIPSLHRFGIGGVGGGWWGSGQGYDGYGGDSSNAVCTTVAGTQITDQKSYTKSVERFSVRVAESRMEEDDGDDDVVLGAESGLTRLVSHEPGWTMFERLYLYNGTLYAVTEEPELYPEMRMMTSTGLPASSEPGNEQAREPTGNELKLITSREAHELWDDRIWRMDGMTWLFNDGQFIDHYYHFAAELLLGVWRAYTSLSSDINSDGTTSLPAPSRAWFIRMTDQSWRDKPRFNPAILWSAFPNIAMLYADDWKDIARATASDTGKGLAKAYVFEQAILADRSAAFRGQATGSTARTVASACKLGDPGRWWWEPVRRQVLRFAGVSEDVLDRNLQGYGAIDPAVLDADPEFQKAISASLQPGDHKPLVTYISRQGSRRRLTKESHEELVAALKSHSVANGWEFLVVEAEKLTKEEQLQLAAKTTVRTRVTKGDTSGLLNIRPVSLQIMLGVHGNGLTHLIWMPPTPRSAVIEMFVDGGFARDYQWTAQHLGIRHFAVQHDKFATAPNEYKVDYPEGFQGTGITVVGEVVAKLIDDRLAGRI